MVLNIKIYIQRKKKPQQDHVAKQCDVKIIPYLVQ